MYLFGEEISLVDSNANFVAMAFKLEFSWRRIFSLPPCQFADVVLPASPSLERGYVHEHGTANPAALRSVRTLEGSRPDWRIIQDIANRLGAKWEYHTSLRNLCAIAS